MNHYKWWFIIFMTVYVVINYNSQTWAWTECQRAQVFQESCPTRLGSYLLHTTFQTPSLVPTFHAEWVGYCSTSPEKLDFSPKFADRPSRHPHEELELNLLPSAPWPCSEQNLDHSQEPPVMEWDIFHLERWLLLLLQTFVSITEIGWEKRKRTNHKGYLPNHISQNTAF